MREALFRGIEMIKAKKNILTIIILFLSFYVISVFIICCEANVMETYRLQEYNKRASYENKVSGDFHLTDMYDTEDSTIYDFFDQIGSLNVLMETYELLLDFDKYYLEISTQPFEYLGFLSIDKSFTDGDDSEQVNQTTDGSSRFTSLKAIQMDASAARLFGLYDEITVLDQYGNGKDAIGVLLGSEYSGIFKIGDEFKIRYLGCKTIRCLVAGFLKKGTTIQIDGTKLSLDNCIISKAISYQEEDSDDYRKTLLSVKCEGYLHYGNLSQRKECVDYIRKIKEATGYKYEIPRIKKEVTTILGLNGFASGIILIIAVLCLYYIYKSIFDNMNRALSDNRLLVIIATILGLTCLALVAYITSRQIFYPLTDMLDRSLLAFISIHIVILFFYKVFFSVSGSVSKRGVKE